jgi:hypothetical protein
VQDCHFYSQMRHVRVSSAPPPRHDRIRVVPYFRDMTSIRYTDPINHSRLFGSPGDQVISSFWRTIRRLVFLPLHYFPINVEKRSWPQRGQLQGFISVFGPIADTLRQLSQRTFGQFGINSMIGAFFLVMAHPLCSCFTTVSDSEVHPLRSFAGIIIVPSSMK